MADRCGARRGFALITVLWSLVGASALAVTVALLARRGVAIATNETAAIRAYWAAEECAALLRAAATEVLRNAVVDSRDPQRTWRALDRTTGTVKRTEGVASCTAHLESNGSRFDINRASVADLQRFFAAINVPPAQTDSVVAALLDWRDSDDLPRPLGAERSWYLINGRIPPRNGPFGNSREVSRVRGIDVLLPTQRAIIDSLTGVETDLVDLWHAPLEVLRTLPGFSPAVTDAVIGLRLDSPGVIGMPQLLSLLRAPARDSVANNYPELIARMETQPEHWLLVARGSSGDPRITSHLELLMGLAGNRLGTVRRRHWLE